MNDFQSNTFSCSKCGHLVQRSDREPSDTIMAKCRGQGSFYSVQEQHGASVVPPFGSHFNFLGLFAGRCCYCALTLGLNLSSFGTIGCYLCKRRQQERRCVVEFAKLKTLLKRKNTPAMQEHARIKLSDELIEMIMRFALEPQETRNR